MAKKGAVTEGPTTVEAKPARAPAPDRRLLGSVEAALLSTERPLTVARLAESVFRPGKAASDSDGTDAPEPQVNAGDRARVQAAVAELNREYESGGRAFRIELVAGGYRLMTLPEYAETVAAVRRARAASKLSKPAVETLAVIAYRQPVTRAQLEAIRGVACGEVLKGLMERRLITIVGRAEELGRPMLYGTTRQFLDHFGLASLKDLPAPAELKPA